MNIELDQKPQLNKHAVISSFFKKFLRFYFYKYSKPIWGNLKGSTKYHLSITFFNKWNLNFRIMNQDNSFYFRNEELTNWYSQIKQRNIKF